LGEGGQVCIEGPKRLTDENLEDNCSLKKVKDRCNNRFLGKLKPWIGGEGGVVKEGFRVDETITSGTAGLTT
jgi:hypothetical protein